MTGKENPKRVRAKNENGKTVTLASLPLVAYALNCNHVGRDYAIQVRDIVFCPECGTSRKVAKILAS